MFDIAFTELLVIGLVALIVIGPERLPKLARTAGQWLGRLNRYVAQVKQDIDRDLKLEELRQLQQEMKETAQRYEILFEETRREIEEETDQVKRVLEAMSTTDQGLTKKAYEALVAEAQTPPKTSNNPLTTLSQEASKLAPNAALAATAAGRTDDDKPQVHAG